MSAIFGAINLKGEALAPSIGDSFLKCYSEYKIDRMEKLSASNMFMGCGIQYFTKEAEGELLPFYDAEKGIYFTADCVVDNREDLIEELGLATDITDSRIILEAYYKWGKKCLDYLRGAFSFVIYDKNTNKVFLATDHFAQRCLMYQVHDGILYFSTLLFPLMESSGLKYENNERWLVDSISLRGPVMLSEPKETALMDVYKIVSGTYIDVQIGSDKVAFTAEYRYYDPMKKTKTDWSITLEESEKMVKKTMSKVISRILRDGVEVASQLSSGLDSSTIACIAAGQLSARGRRLHTFTSVPLDEANLPTKGYEVFNERKGVEEICRAYPNIEPTFVNTQGRNYILETEDILNYWEMPCKSQQNAVWVDEISHLAAEKGCRIIFTGATGNTTLSAGDSACNFAYYAKHFRPIKALKMLNPAKKLGWSRKKYIKIIAEEFVDYWKWFFDEDARDVYKNNATGKIFGEKYDVTDRLNKEFLHNYPMCSMKEMRRQMYMVIANAQIGELDTKQSLRSGVITRDPMRSVEMVDMCMKLPIECYASSDFDRRLVRAGMKGIVPATIREDMAHRGRQSGDNFYRVRQVWDTQKDYIKQLLYSDSAMKYFDAKKIDSLFEELDSGIENVQDIDLLLLVDLYSFSKYLEVLEEKKNAA